MSIIPSRCGGRGRAVSDNERVPTNEMPLKQRKMMDHYRNAIREGGFPFPYSKTIGFRLTEVEPGRAVVEMEAAGQHRNTIGTIHGGVHCSIADTALGIAHGSLLGEDEISTTVDLQIKFLKAVTGGRLRAEAKVVKHGRTLTLIECDVTDAEGNLVARALSTCMTLRRKPQDRQPGSGTDRATGSSR